MITYATLVIRLMPNLSVSTSSSLENNIAEDAPNILRLNFVERIPQTFRTRTVNSRISARRWDEALGSVREVVAVV